MTRARDDRRRNNRAAFVESFTRPHEWTARLAAAVTSVIPRRGGDRRARVGVEVTPTQQ